MDVTKLCAEPTFYARIYMSGPIEIAKQALRQECLREGLCVTVEPTTFVYTGGEEAGFVVGLLDYPRFPSGKEKVLARARQVATLLLEATCQHSAMIQTPEQTIWWTTREQQ